MSSIVKSSTVQFTYALGPERSPQLKRPIKQNAPEAYYIPEELRPYVKRYTNHTYHYIQLVNGETVRTRVFLANPDEYTSRIKLKDDEWGEALRYNLTIYTQCDIPTAEEIGYTLCSLYACSNKEGTKVRLRITGQHTPFMDVTYDTTPEYVRHLEGIMVHLAYALRKMSYGACTGQTDSFYFSLIHRILTDPKFYKQAIPTQKDYMRKVCEYFPNYPTPDETTQLLRSLDDLVDGLEDFPETMEMGAVRKKLFVANYVPEIDSYNLNEIAAWLESNDDKQPFRESGFTNGIRAQAKTSERKQLYQIMQQYVIYRGLSNWSFHADKTNLLDFMLAFVSLSDKSTDISSHVTWINVWRALRLYKAGKITLLDPSRAGEQLAELNKRSKETMTDESDNLVGLSYQQIRQRHIYKTVIRPDLKKLMSK